MPASTPKGAQATLSSLIKTTNQHLYKQFPHHESRLKALIAKKFPTGNTSSVITPANYVFKPALPQEEVGTVIEKAHQLSMLPGLSFDKETELYLEQQLEDVLGFGLSSTLNSLKLPFTKGTLESLPHLLSLSTDTPRNQNFVPEAGTAVTRAYFGWHIGHLPDESHSISPSPYWISFPFRQWVSENKSLSDIKQWIYKRKMILINPTDAMFAVVEVLDEYAPPTTKYQLGASPEVVRQGLFWSPQNLGKVMVFFLAESETTPKQGVYSLF